MPQDKQINVIIETLLKNEKFKKAMKENQRAGTNSVKGMKKQEGGLKKLRSGYLAVAAAMTGVIAAAKKMIDNFFVQERAERTLAAAMKQAGTFTQKAMKHNLEYAASLQKMTTFGDEAILGVQKMLTNFGVEGEMLDKLTKATLDLAAAKGMDLKAAADLVAKSVGSSTNALTRYGIEVTGAVGSSERMETAVDNITRLFGGAAAAEADTYAGKIQQMKNALGDLSEVAGKELIQSIEKATGDGGFKQFIESEKAVTGVRRAIQVLSFAVELSMRMVIIPLFLSLRAVIKNVLAPIENIRKQWEILSDSSLTLKERMAALGEVGKGTFQDMKNNVIEFGTAHKQNAEEMIESTRAIFSPLDDLADKYEETDEDILKSAARRVEQQKRLEEELLKKRQQSNIKSVRLAQEYAKTIGSIASGLVQIEKNKLDAIDEADTVARERQKEKIREAMRTEKRVKMAVAAIDAAAAILKTMASVPYPLNIPLAALQAAAGAVQIRTIKTTPIPSFARGISEVPHDELAKIHKRERIIPANMNIPGVSNAQFANAAAQGLALARGDTYNQNTVSNNQKHITISGLTIQTESASNLLDQLEELAEDTNTRLLSR